MRRIVDKLLLGLEQAKNIGEADKDRVIRTLLMNGITGRHLALMYPEWFGN